MNGAGPYRSHASPISTDVNQRDVQDEIEQRHSAEHEERVAIARCRAIEPGENRDGGAERHQQEGGAKEDTWWNPGTTRLVNPGRSLHRPRPRVAVDVDGAEDNERRRQPQSQEKRISVRRAVEVPTRSSPKPYPVRHDTDPGHQRITDQGDQAVGESDHAHPMEHEGGEAAGAARVRRRCHLRRGGCAWAIIATPNAPTSTRSAGRSIPPARSSRPLMKGPRTQQDEDGPGGGVEGDTPTLTSVNSRTISQSPRVKRNQESCGHRAAALKAQAGAEPRAEHERRRADVRDPSRQEDRRRSSG